MAATNGAKHGGANGGGGSGVGIASARKQKKNVTFYPEDKRFISQSVWQPGAYIDADENEHEIGYTKQGGEIYMTIDNKVTSGAHVRVNASGSTVAFTADYDPFEDFNASTTRAFKAGKGKESSEFAFGKPSDFGWRKKK